MRSSLPALVRCTLVAAATVGLSACASMLGKERSAYVLVRTSVSAPARVVPPGPVERTIERLVSRQNYTYTRDDRAAWLIYVDERPAKGGGQEPRFVIGEVMRNPQSKYPEEPRLSPREIAALHHEHPSLRMLQQYEQAEQSRGHSGP